MGCSQLHLVPRGNKKGKGGFVEAAIKSEKRSHRKVYTLNFILSNDGDATVRTYACEAQKLHNGILRGVSFCLYLPPPATERFHHLISYRKDTFLSETLEGSR